MTRLLVFLSGMLILSQWLFASQPGAARLGKAAVTATPVCGTIGSSATWTTAVSPYDICNGGATIPAGVTVTVQPGVVVEFLGNGNAFLVQGALIAQGTAAAPVTITGVTQANGAWRGINVSGSVSAKAVLTLDYTNVQYGGAFQVAEIDTDQATVTIDHSSIQNSASSGLEMTANTTFDVRSSSFLNNTLDAINLPEPKGDMNLTALTASGNGGMNGVHISGINTSMAGQRHWNAPGIPYFVDGSIHNAAGDILTIAPGSELDFNSSSSIIIGGELDAQGSATAPILMSGMSKSPGGWRGIVDDGGSLRSAAVNLDYVTVEYGGQDIGGAAVVVSNGFLRAQHSTIRNSSKDGVLISNISIVSILNSSVYGNVLYGIRNTYPSRPILASNNWWGAASGPHSDISICGSGAGDKVTGGVMFLPFAAAQNATQTFPLSSYPSMLLTPLRWYAPADGSTRMYFTITLRDGNGLPLPGRVISLSSSLGSVVDGGITDANGTTLAYLTSNTVGNAIVSASVSGLTACEGVQSPEANVTFTPIVNGTDLMQNSLSPYANSDISVSPMPVIAGVPTTFSARLTNPLTTPVTVDASFDLVQSGIGLVFGPIHQFTGQVIPAKSSVVLSAVWSPPESGHYCFKVDYNITAVGAASLQQVTAGSSVPLNLNVYQASTSGGGGGGGKPNALNKTNESLKNVNRFVSATYSPNPAAIPLAVANRGIAWDLDNADKIDKALKGDPPRQDYTQIDLPVVHQLAPIQPGAGGVSAARAAALNDLDAALAQANAYGTAAATAFDRSGGAAEAGSLQWESTQTGIMQEYNQKYGAALIVAAQKIDALLNQAASEGTTSMVISLADVQAMQLNLQTNGFSAEQIADAHMVGLTDADIEATRQDIINANPSDLAGDLVPAMRQIRDNFNTLGALLENPPTFAPGLSVGGAKALNQVSSGNSMAQVFDTEGTFVLANQTAASEDIVLSPRRISLPADWDVTVSPSSVTLAAGQQITVTVLITPGSPAPQGIVPRVAVEASSGATLLGGVVVDVVVPIYTPFDGKLRVYLPEVGR